MAPEPPGICPNCGKRTGPVGAPCPVEVCGDKGYSFIPRPWYESAKQFAARKQRPLDPLLGRSIDRYLLAGKIGKAVAQARSGARREAEAAVGAGP